MPLFAMPLSIDRSPDLLTAPLKPEQKLGLLAQNSPLAMIEWDSNLTVVAWNPAAAELFDFFEEEAIGQPLAELLKQRQIANLGKEDWKSCDPAGILRAHVNITGKKLCRWYNTPLWIREEQKQIGTLATIIDVTHQTALSNEELRSQLHSRTRVLKHTTERLQSAMSDRAQTDVALRASETRFRNLAANVPGVLYQFCLHPDGSYTFPYISASCQDIYELSAEQIKKSAAPLLAMFGEEERRRLKKAMRASAINQSPWHSEHRITPPSGQVKWVKIASQPQRMHSGDVLWSGMLTDITERKKADHKLQAAHTFLRNLINGIAEPVFVKDQNHKWILLNDAFCTFMGRSRADLLGRNDADFFSPETAEKAFRQDNQVIESGQAHVSKRYFSGCRQSLKNTEDQLENTPDTRLISTIKTRFYALDRSPYLLGIIHDLTEQANAQIALQENEKQLKKLTANVPGMLYQFCLSAELSPSFPFVSSSSQTIFECAAADIMADAQLLIDKVHPDELDSFNNSIVVSAQTLADWHWQGRFILPSDRIIWIQGASRPERRPDNSIVWDGLLMDITDSKESEAALQLSETQLRLQTQQLTATLQQLRQTQSKLIQSEKMSSLGQLVAGIAHEINNPVNFIHGNLTHAQGYIEDLLTIVRLYQAHYPAPILAITKISEELELDYVLHDLPKLLNSVQAGADRIRQIVLSLRNFSRLDESELKEANIHEGIESSLMILSNRLKATASRHAIEVVKAYENIPRIDCYVSQLNQVFMSILVNAIDAIDGSSTPDKIYQIVLQTFQRGSHVVIRITNNGPPIKRETGQRMFDPFFTTKPVGKGTGMGLAISYQTIVDLHQGSLEYTQTADQKTVFTIEIPIEIPKGNQRQ